jgi:hypothetical protein
MQEKIMRGGLIAIGVAAMGIGGCGVQASEEFTGESLLSLRGSVSVDPLSARPDSIPALCFTKQERTSQTPVDKLPEHLRAFVGGNFQSSLAVNNYIVDVEARGSFPAEFDVDVIAPPPTEAMERLFPGEPLSAFGVVCAVAPQHKPVAQEVLGFSMYDCDTTNMAPCEGGAIRLTQDGSRYLYKTWDCENGADASTCDTTTEGDTTLLKETGGVEGVYGFSQGLNIVYLTEPAPPGSYTAHRALAPEGLSAGYHIRPATAERKPDAPETCFQVSLDAALEETNALHGTQYSGLPEYWDEESASFKLAPEEVIADYRHISARVEMENCPLENLIIPEVSTASLSIELISDGDGLDLVQAPWTSRPPREDSQPEN